MSETPKAPHTKQEVEQCFLARDQFFNCLDLNNITQSLLTINQQRVRESCSQEKQEFTNVCTATFVSAYQAIRDRSRKRKEYVEVIIPEKGYKEVITTPIEHRFYDDHYTERVDRPYVWTRTLAEFGTKEALKTTDK